MTETPTHTELSLHDVAQNPEMSPATVVGGGAGTAPSSASTVEGSPSGEGVGDEPASDLFQAQLPPAFGCAVPDRPARRQRVTKLAPTERRPPNHVEKRLVLGESDCTALFHERARNELKRVGRLVLSPDALLVAEALASDCTIGGQYYWSQQRLAYRCHISRWRVNQALKELGQQGLISLSRQRHFHAPKTITLASRLMTKIMRSVWKTVHRLRSNSRESKTPVERGGKLPSLDQLLPRFERRHRYGGGWMVRCPCHDDRTPSLSLAEGTMMGASLVWYCHAGCSSEDVRAALLALGERPQQ
jgi:biotin operon repressor